MARPLIWLGRGAKTWPSGIPYVTTWTGARNTDDPLNVGIVGVCGHPGANRCVHEADELMVIGSGFHPTQTGSVLPKAGRVDRPSDPEAGWLERCLELKKQKVPLVGSYKFNDRMTRLLPAGTMIVIDGGGTALYTGFQSSYLKEGSQLVCSTAISAMGSGLPEAVGACLANGGRLTTLLVGDGSLLFNMQELQTIKHLNLPIKVFVLNNQGYLAIRHTQDLHLEGRYSGTGEPDLSIPPIQNIATCFNLPYTLIEEPYPIEEIQEVLDLPGPFLVEVITPKDQKIIMGKDLSK